MNAAERVRAFLTARTGHADGEPTDPVVAETFDWDTAQPVYLREADLEALLQTIDILAAVANPRRLMRAERKQRNKQCKELLAQNDAAITKLRAEFKTLKESAPE